MSGRETFVKLARYLGSDAVDAGYSQGATERWDYLDKAAVSALFKAGQTPSLSQLMGAIRKHSTCDCSSAAFGLAWLAYNGAVSITGTAYTGNLAAKFKDSGLFKVIRYDSHRSVKAQAAPGDLLLTPGHHVVVVLDGDVCLSPEFNERGRTTGGKPGDQTGREVKIRPLYVRPGGWRYIVRPIRASEFEGRVLAALSKGTSPSRVLDLLRICAPWDGPRWDGAVKVWLSLFGGLPLVYDSEGYVTHLGDGAEPGAHAFVILGSSKAKMARRVDAALPAILENPESLVLVSGGVKRDGQTEAAIMADRLTAAGVDPSRIILEEGSSSTVGNANKSVPLLVRAGVKTYTLVSDASHLRRATLDFTAAQLRIETATNTRTGLAWLTPIAYNDYGTKPVKTEAPVAANDRAVMVREVALVLGLSSQFKNTL